MANEQHMQWLWDFSGRMPFWIGKYIGCKSPLKTAVPGHHEKQKLLQQVEPRFQTLYCPQISAAFITSEEGVNQKL